MISKALINLFPAVIHEKQSASLQNPRISRCLGHIPLGMSEITVKCRKFLLRSFPMSFNKFQGFPSHRRQLLFEGRVVKRDGHLMVVTY